ncbi:MAG: AraC family transcriptional regulator [Thermoanaerobaculia bacterium]|nr:AraC family transcriptional regulator [Thermoanaerobaculia bacterium]
MPLSHTHVPAVIATAPSSAMTLRARKPRIFTHAHRQRLDAAIAHYLDECYANRSAARVSEFAAFLKRNAEYLTRTTASIVGVSLREYLRTKQIEEAERLITTTPLPMYEIALHAGFGTTSTFYRCFRQAHGMPPGAFREVRK